MYGIFRSREVARKKEITVMKYLSYLILFFFPVFVFVIEYQPWFGNIYEFNLLSRYAYSNFSSIDSAISPLKKRSNNHLVYLGLEFPVSPEFSIDGDIEFVDTSKQPFCFSSIALQARYLIYDDIIGDKVSLALGGNLRFTSSRSLRDVAIPYQGNCDLEATIAIGKEFDQFESWKFRMWGFGGIGISNRGSPWLFGLMSVEGSFPKSNKWSLFLLSTHGYGHGTVIDINNFYGYGNIREKNVDIGGKLGHRFGVWGTLSIEYKHRLYGKHCPKDEMTFSINYLLPFSF